MDKQTPTEFKNLKDAAEYSHVTKQAVYLAINLGKLKARKENNRWVVNVADLEEYRLNKYSRDKRKLDGQLIFDVDKGHFSVLHVSKMLSYELKRTYSMQKIYYLMRMGRLKAFKKGAAWVILKEDVASLLQIELALSDIFKRAEEG